MFQKMFVTGDPSDTGGRLEDSVYGPMTEVPPGVLITKQTPVLVKIPTLSRTSYSSFTLEL